MWIIYYDDGSKFSDKDGSPEDAPGLGVVCIADTQANYTAHAWDWYYWRPSRGEWWGATIHGLIYQLCCHPKDTYAVKQGAMVTTEFYQQCLADAFEARTPTERTPVMHTGTTPDGV